MHLGIAALMVGRELASPTPPRPVRPIEVVWLGAPTPPNAEDRTPSSLQAEQLRSDRPSPREVPVDEPEPMTPESPTDFERYVRTERDDHVAVHTETFSDHNRRAEQITRARATSLDEGERRPDDGERDVDGLSTKAGAGFTARRGGMRVAFIGGGGTRAHHDGTSSNSASGDTANGGAAARLAAGSIGAGAGPANHGAGGIEGFVRAIDGNREQQMRGNASDVTADGNGAAPTVGFAQTGFVRDATSPTASDGVAATHNVGTGHEAGRPGFDVDVPGARGVGPNPQGPTEGRADAWTDPVDDLRAFMGWQRPEFTDLDGPTTSGSGPGARGQSAQATESRVFREYADVSARKDPLGDYMRRVEDRISESWLESDLSVRDRTAGIQGDVVVQYTITRSGRVENIELVRESGHVPLDLLALSAIPQRLPRIPNRVGRDVIHHQVALRYRNPLILVGTR